MGSLAKGAILAGRFRLEEPLQDGGQAETWRATDLRRQLPRVLKVMPRRPPHPAVVQRFEREAKILIELRHPHVVRAFDYFHTDGRMVIVLDVVEGRSLRDLLWRRARSGNPLQNDEVWRLAKQLTFALDACHRRGIIHRDVKPSNILNSPTSTEAIRHITLIDFGIARVLDTDQGQATTIGRIVGTPRYASPEQLLGQPATPASDFFSLASVIYEATTLRRPWLRDDDGAALPLTATEEPPGNDRGSVTRRILDGVLPPVSKELDPEGRISEWMQQALARRAEERFADSTAYLEGLRSALDVDVELEPVDGMDVGRTIVASVPQVELVPPFEPLKLRWALALVALASLVLAAAMLLRVTRTSETSPDANHREPRPVPTVRPRPTVPEVPPSPSSNQDPVEPAPLSEPRPPRPSRSGRSGPQVPRAPSASPATASPPSLEERLQALNQSLSALPEGPSKTRLARCISMAQLEPGLDRVAEALRECEKLRSSIE